MAPFDLIKLLRLSDSGAKTNALQEGDQDPRQPRTKDDVRPPPPWEPPGLADDGGRAEGGEDWGGGRGISPHSQAGRKPTLPFPSREAWPRFNMQRWRGWHRGVPYFKQRIYNKGPEDAGICQNSAMGEIYLSKPSGGACDLGLESFRANRRLLKTEQRDACDYII